MGLNEPATLTDIADMDAKNRVKALVVEDEAHIRELVGLHLRLEELEVTEGPLNGNAGLELARAQPFDDIGAGPDVARHRRRHLVPCDPS